MFACLNNICSINSVCDRDRERERLCSYDAWVTSPITSSQICNAPHTHCVKVTHLVYSSCLLGWNEAHHHSDANRHGPTTWLVWFQWLLNTNLKHTGPLVWCYKKKKSTEIDLTLNSKVSNSFSIVGWGWMFALAFTWYAQGYHFPTL